MGTYGLKYKKGDFMKTRKYLEGILQTMFEKSNLDSEFEPMITELRDNIRERDKYLSEFGETWDEESNDFEFKRKESEYKSDGNEWEIKYNDLRKRYSEKFFNGEAALSNVDDNITEKQAIMEQNEDIRADGRANKVEDFLIEVNQ